MISVSQILACLVTLVVSGILPLAALIVITLRHRQEGLPWAWFLGAAGFFVTQILIRTPILNMLSGSAGFLAFAQNHLILYSLGLAFTAGLFELVGRYTAAKLLERQGLSYRKALAAGMGHGGIEAMMLVGATYINNLILMFLIRSGAFDTIMAQAGGDVSQLVAAKDILINTGAGMFLMAGLERLLTMICHAGFSILVFWGVYAGCTGKMCLICLGLHTLIDSAAGVSLLAADAGGNKLSPGAAYAIIYGVLAIVAGVCVWILWDIRRRWSQEEGEF